MIVLSVLELEFEQCEKENVDKVKDDIIDERIEEADCELDAYNNTDIIYDFIEVPTFVTMLSSDRNHVFILRYKSYWEKILLWKTCDDYGHEIMHGEKYFEGRYMEINKEKNVRWNIAY